MSLCVCICSGTIIISTITTTTIATIINATTSTYCARAARMPSVCIINGLDWATM